MPSIAWQHEDDTNAYLPSQEEITKACKEIRMNLSDEERELRGMWEVGKTTSFEDDEDYSWLQEDFDEV